MTWAHWLGLGFGLGFAAAAYIFSKGVRSRVHAVIKGVVWGSRSQESATPATDRLINSKARSTPRKNGRKQECFICHEKAPEAELIQATVNKVQVWVHQECTGKLPEVKSKFDYKPIDTP